MKLTRDYTTLKVATSPYYTPGGGLFADFDLGSPGESGFYLTVPKKDQKSLTLCGPFHSQADALAVSYLLDPHRQHPSNQNTYSSGNYYSAEDLRYMVRDPEELGYTKVTLTTPSNLTFNCQAFSCERLNPDLLSRLRQQAQEDLKSSQYTSQHYQLPEDAKLLDRDTTLLWEKITDYWQEHGGAPNTPIPYELAWKVAEHWATRFSSRDLVSAKALINRTLQKYKRFLSTKTPSSVPLPKPPVLLSQDMDDKTHRTVFDQLHDHIVSEEKDPPYRSLLHQVRLSDGRIVLVRTDHNDETGEWEMA
jgi:hypothetical protein